MMKSRHFRIKEYQHLKNSIHVDGCPDRFEKCFGESEFVTEKDMVKVLASCFQPPFGFNYRRNLPMGPLTDRERLGKGWGLDLMDAQGIFLTDDPRTRLRKLVLVGHDVPNDIAFLRQIGFDPTKLSTVVEALDTGHLYQALKQEDQMKSLGMILYELDIVGWNLHNAVSHVIECSELELLLWLLLLRIVDLLNSSAMSCFFRDLNLPWP